MKVPDKNIPKQTKEEEIGSFPEKYFRTMREKMTQILKAKWSCQQIHWRLRLKRKKHVYHASRRNKEKTSSNNQCNNRLAKPWKEPRVKYLRQRKN